MLENKHSSSEACICNAEYTPLTAIWTHAVTFGENTMQTTESRTDRDHHLFPAPLSPATDRLVDEVSGLRTIPVAEPPSAEAIGAWEAEAIENL